MTISARIKFTVTASERALISAIVNRARMMKRLKRTDPQAIDLDMDITACHANGCPLNLQKLLDADDFNFSHDVFGIHRHLNRETGRLMHHFLPRCHA